MSSQDDKRLIVGLGNPGARYEGTRHNFGFMVAEALAERHGWSFKSPFRVKGKLALGQTGSAKIFLLMPHTYMNLSGEAVARVMRLYGLATHQVMIIVDDVAIPFGRMRLRTKGSSGGHNGLISIEQALQTQEYLRLRMGIGQDRPVEPALETFVLSRFNCEEEAQLPKLVASAVELLEYWLANGTESAVKQAGSIK